MTPELLFFLHCKFIIVFPSTVGNAFQRKPKQSATPMLPPSLQLSLEMGEAAAQVAFLSKLSAHSLLSPICLYSTLVWFALSSCCILHPCNSICPHTSFLIGFCHFLNFFLFFWLIAAPQPSLSTSLMPVVLHTLIYSLHSCHTWPWALNALRAREAFAARGGCSRYPQPFRSISTGHKAVCKSKYPSRVLKGLQLVETSWGSHGSLAEEARQYF